MILSSISGLRECDDFGFLGFIPLWEFVIKLVMLVAHHSSIKFVVPLGIIIVSPLEIITNVDHEYASSMHICYQGERHVVRVSMVFVVHCLFGVIHVFLYFLFFSCRDIAVIKSTHHCS